MLFSEINAEKLKNTFAVDTSHRKRNLINYGKNTLFIWRIGRQKR